MQRVDMQMKEKLIAFWNKIKTKWSSISKKLKIIIVSSLALVIVAAIVLTVVLNKSDGYIVLFPNMDSSESAEVYNILKAQGVAVRINKDGEIEVPQGQWDQLVYELAEKGYPQSTPSYGTFFDNLGMTMTDFEKRQTLRFELQDR
jgi:flagellar M-ring protein FliF